MILTGIKEAHDETNPKLRKIIVNLFHDDLKSDIAENELHEVLRFGNSRKNPNRPIAITFTSEKRQEEIIRAAIEEDEWFKRGIGMEVDNAFSAPPTRKIYPH